MSMTGCADPIRRLQVILQNSCKAVNPMLGKRPIVLILAVNASLQWLHARYAWSLQHMMHSSRLRAREVMQSAQKLADNSICMCC